MDSTSTNGKFSAYFIIGALSTALILVMFSRIHYLLFHSIAEIFSIVIAGAVFMISWNVRKEIENSFLVLLGIAYLFIGIIDLFHTLSYVGMNIFTDYDYYANQLWIGARYIESLSLLAFFALSGSKIRFTFGSVIVFYASITSALLLSVFYWKVFPICFVEGQGLTVFKKVSEYIISAFLLLSLIVLHKKKDEFDIYIRKQLTWAILLTVMSELAFTFYISNYGLSNLVGHFMKIASFYFIYKAIVETGLKRPIDLMFRKLKLSEGRFKNLVNTMNSGVAIYKVINNGKSGSDFIIQDFNQYALQHEGLELKDIVGKSLKDIRPAIDEYGLIDTFRRVWESGNSEFFPAKVYIDDKFANYYENRVFRLQNGELVAIYDDVSTQKRAEEQIQASLKEKEILLQEIHHRVKNNMTVIASLLDLQMNNTDNNIAKEALQDSQNRVQSMSMIHETLYRSDNLSAIDLKMYLTELGKNIIQNYSMGNAVQFKVEAEKIMISLKQASPIGLIINELIANCLKYAFPGDRMGEIGLSLKAIKENGIEIAVSDNGVGIPDDFDLKTADSLGLKLVKLLAEDQLDGSIDMESNNGTKFTIKFNIET
jgi:two-component sensor histidine kinase